MKILRDTLDHPPPSDVPTVPCSARWFAPCRWWSCVWCSSASRSETGVHPTGIRRGIAWCSSSPYPLVGFHDVVVIRIIECCATDWVGVVETILAEDLTRGNDLTLYVEGARGIHPNFMLIEGKTTP